MRLYRGGALNEDPDRLWRTESFAYAAGFAQLYESPLWLFDVDLDERTILDLTACGFDVSAVLAALAGVGIAATRGSASQPQVVIDALSSAAVRASGHRAIRVWERTDWGASGAPHEAQALCLIDLGAVRRREDGCYPA